MPPPLLPHMLPPGVIVLGPYRCSTSYLSHLLARRGVDFGPAGDLYPGDEWNPWGYFQRPDVLEANDTFIASAGFAVFEGAEQAKLDQFADQRVLARVDLGWRARSGLWGLKDPRFCVTLMSWYRAGLLGNSVGLIRLRRPAEDSARSLLRHPELAAQLRRPRFEEALQVIIRYHALADVQEQLFPGPRIVLRFDDVIDGDHATLSAIDRFLSEMREQTVVADPAPAQEAWP